LPGEFEKQVRKLGLDPKTEKELIAILNRAAEEDPCVDCSSKDGCDNFKWHIKWFNQSCSSK
jgi:hypothetical protein